MIKKQIQRLISLLGFKENSDNKSLFSKTYENFDYSISVDFANNKIDYGNQITLGDLTTSHLQKPENIVVLECVNRLLEKGYNPTDITLEKKWKLGRSSKSGKADITIKGKSGKVILIIECKTFGVEYDKELKNMKINGGQLFSYFQQEKNTKFLCLYSSKLNDNNIEYINSIWNVEDSIEEKIRQQESIDIITYANARNIKELIDVWKFKTKAKFTSFDSGIFEDGIEPYNPVYVPIKIKDLSEFKANDTGMVFNKFEEILRHNNISDRSNAFNRFISIVLAKIVDETKEQNEIADFQVKDGIDDPESLLERLQELYARAMKDFLKENVVNYRIEEIEKQIQHFPRQTAKDTLLRIYKELKFYQNNEFAFKEIYNKELFEENAMVLEEIVRLFQEFRFKYERKSQFLGDFFESMLEDGYRQSEGQFFTPTPITKFMLSSLPIANIIQNKLDNDEKYILPYIIDFACGSGHFLTEAIDEVINVLESLYKGNKNKIYEELLKNTKWAGEYTYGIEKDYRLARTSQVACFLHGDGDANIIFGDGLEQHNRLPNDRTFDILIANPPYTIDNFKPYLKINSSDYELWNEIPDTSDDIEVLFIERMKQLLKDGGFASIVLPQWVLTSGGVFSKARTFLLEYFEFISIIELGSSTFGATGTKTYILFLKRRSDQEHINCKYIAEDFILNKNFREGDFINSIDILTDYAENLGFSLDDYFSLLDQKPNSNINNSDLFIDYKENFIDQPEYKKTIEKKFFKDLSKKERSDFLKNMFFEFIHNIEFEKFYHFILAHRISETQNAAGKIKADDKITIHYPIYTFEPQNVLIANTGKKVSDQNKFLGYKFSKRKGQKGIKILSSNSLFDYTNRFNESKLNGYVYKNYLKEKSSIPDSLKNNVCYLSLADCIEFDKIEFDAMINTSGIVNIDYQSIWQTENIDTLKKIADINKGTSITEEATTVGNIPVVAGGKEPAYFHNQANRKNNTITVSASGAYAGYVNYWDKEIFASDCSTIVSKKEKDFPTKLIYFYLKFIQEELYSLQRGGSQPHVYPKDLKKVKLPVLDSKNAKSKLNKIEKVLKDKSKFFKSNMSNEQLAKIIHDKIGDILINGN